MRLDYRHLFDPTALQRGAELVTLGQVAFVTDPQPSGLVRAGFLRTGPEGLEIDLRLRFDTKERLTAIPGKCNVCRTWPCEHAAAALQVLEARGDADLAKIVTGARDLPGFARNPLPEDVTRWLGAYLDLEQDRQLRPLDYPSWERERLVYALSLREGELDVTVLLSHVDEDGCLSEQGQPLVNQSYGELARASSSWLLQPDVEILGELDLLGFGAESLKRGRAPLPDRGFSRILPLMIRIAATGRGRWGGRRGPLLQHCDPKAGEFAWIALPDGEQEMALLTASGRQLTAIPGRPPVWIDPETGEFGELETGLSPDRIRILAQAPRIPARMAAKVRWRLAGARAGGMPLPDALEMKTVEDVTPVPVLELRGRPSSAGTAADGRVVFNPALMLSFDYDGKRAVPNQGGDLHIQRNGALTTIKRNREAEAAAVTRLNGFGAFATGAGGGLMAFLDATGTDASAEAMRSALNFLSQGVPELSQEGWKIVRDSSWPIRLIDQPSRIRATVTGEGPAARLGVSLSVAGQSIDMVPLVASLLGRLPRDMSEEFVASREFETLISQKAGYVRLSPGEYAPMDLGRLVDVVRVFVRHEGLVTKARRPEPGEVASVAQKLDGCGVPVIGGEELIELGRRFSRLSDPEAIQPPDAFKATLRAYQATGYGWLRTLFEMGHGGILADDMGLGKTLQALALLVHVHLEQREPAPSLVVLPTSLVGTWLRHAREFAPELKVLVLHGSGRHGSFSDIADHHVILTTYPLLHRDHQKLLTRFWSVAILDEGQQVKNPASGGARLIRDIRATTRLILTGTPVENALMDLWTLMDWVMPGLLGDRRSFKAGFQTPIERDGDEKAQAELNRRVKPFILRRTKNEVAADLPEKTEITELVPLGDEQRALYESIRLAMDKRIRAVIAERGVKGSTISILDALLRMRQACCDPGLLKQQNTISESAKRERLIGMLGNLVGEGRRVLVFSQFVEMLRLIEADVKREGWSYEWLSGQTKDRDAAVDRFQDGKSSIFLISLKAGGTGLTLTAADTVILYDPWWNPAVERQAMDRAHRIGQTQKVFVYRLVAEGTVEETILGLQARKQALADAVFEGGATRGFDFDLETIEELFGSPTRAA
ncbi:DEAD/DEAH box helicase [Cereibacter sphaeroides]|uniref:SNF2-related protein n=1 Tax=Cereibacter sphaeroides TaxID=1063 RepID=UPI001F2BC2F2|nr:DEAD/DEAH box helicase [Cereibacter sphaeroides]MCE6958742.1 DEAD/DEAH box helicase [Cereibacter sphaeroides]MCE6973384.1 DEAD/DEAH box helicase [Cereibacter sphaeroides]